MDHFLFAEAAITKTHFLASVKPIYLLYLCIYLIKYSANFVCLQFFTMPVQSLERNWDPFFPLKKHIQIMPCIKLLLLLLIIRMCRNKLNLNENENGKTKLMSNNHISDHDLDLEFPKRNCHNEIIELNNKIKKLEETVTNLKKAKSKDRKQHYIEGENIIENHNVLFLTT